MGVTHAVAADYLVVGAGATGMAFVDALVEHTDVRVALVDRRPGVGGHWLDAYPFVRLHQASAFYGVGSTLLGANRVQERGPEAGLHERASVSEICAYYAQLLAERLQPSDRVEWFPGCDYVGGRRFVSRVSGRVYEVPEGCRVVDARYLAPSIPARTAAPFEVDDAARVVTVNGLVELEEPPSRFVVVGSGKTATDAVVWLLGQGVDPGAVCWVRPRDPWMLNRAVVQPAPAVFLGMVADTLEAAGTAESLDQLFLELEERGSMLRIDPSVTPTMGKTPTLATWELERLRTVEHVVRRGHLRRVRPGHLDLDEGSVAVARDAVVVHCAAPGLRYPPRVPIWGPAAITLQPIRSGFPCFGAALAGYVEATRADDADKNALCPPTPFGDSLEGWAHMTVLGARAAASFGAEPDVLAWSHGVALNPARISPQEPSGPDLDDALARLQRHAAPGLARLASLSGLADLPDPQVRIAW